MVRWVSPLRAAGVDASPCCSQESLLAWFKLVDRNLGGFLRTRLFPLASFSGSNIPVLAVPYHPLLFTGNSVGSGATLCPGLDARHHTRRD